MTEKEEKNNSDIFNSPEDILNEYGDLFTQNENLWIENYPYYDNGIHRIVISSDIPFLISSSNLNHIWELDIENGDDWKIFLEGKYYAKKCKDIDSKDVRDYMSTIFTGKREYTIRALPFGHRHSSDVLRFLLDAKKEGKEKDVWVNYLNNSNLFNQELLTEISTPKELLERYRDMFRQAVIANTSLYLEWDERNLKKKHSEQERFVLTKEGIFQITSKSNSVWDLDISNPVVPDLLFRYMYSFEKRNPDIDTNMSFEIMIENKKYLIEYLFPNVENSEYIVTSLERRKDYLLQE